MPGKFALIVGNSHYEDSSLARLTAPIVDVHGLAEVLKAPDIGQFDEVTTLLDEDFASARKAIARFYDLRQRDDLLFLYFSGHGVKDEQGHLYLAARDTDCRLLAGTAIESAFVRDRMDGSHSKRQVLVLDCCHSGAFPHGAKAAQGLSVGTAEAFQGTGLGRVVITATDATQYALEGSQVLGNAQNSLFTHFLIDGLKTGAADRDGRGVVSVDELYDYVREQVLNTTPRQAPQKWTYRQPGEIILAKNPSAKNRRGKASDIFISYAREDRAKAKALAEALGARGWNVWWDRKIAPGEAFDVVIERELGVCKCAIVLWSRRSVNATWVRNEARRASKRNVLVPILIDSVDVPLEFENLQAADLTTWEGAADHPELEDIFDRIRALSPVVDPIALLAKEERRRAEEERQRAEEERQRAEEELRKAKEDELKRAEEAERLKAEARQREAEAQRQREATERLRVEAERRRAEAERRRLEAERQREAEVERQRVEAERRRLEAERQREAEAQRQREEAERLRVEAERQRIETERRSQAAGLIAEAREAYGEKQFAAALERLRAAQLLWPDAPEGAELLREVNASIDAAERLEAQIRDLLARASKRLKKRDYERASALVDSALRLDAQHAEALALLAAIEQARQEPQPIPSPLSFRRSAMYAAPAAVAILLAGGIANISRSRSGRETPAPIEAARTQAPSASPLDARPLDVPRVIVPSIGPRFVGTPAAGVTTAAPPSGEESQPVLRPSQPGRSPQVLDGAADRSKTEAHNAPNTGSTSDGAAPQIETSRPKVANDPAPVPSVEIKQRPPAVDQPQTPPQQPARDPAADEEQRILRLLDEYRAAYEQMDPNAVSRIHPTLSPSQLTGTFKQYRSFAMSIANPKISLSGNQAVVTCTITTNIRPRVGDTQSFTRPTTLRLQKTGQSWVIVDRR